MNVTQDDLIDSLSGALSVTAIAVCPLDVLRTRFQVQAKERKTVGGFRLIAKEEGVYGFYRGLSPTLIALVPNWAVYFAVYEHLKQLYLPRVEEDQRYLVHMMSAVASGATTAMVTNPLWVVKTRLQTQDMGLPIRWTRYSGTFDALQKIASQEGISRLYAGLAPAMIGTAHVAVQFPLYEYLKDRISLNKGDELAVTDLLVASSLSKMVASTVTYPHEVLRAHMHMNGTGPFGGVGFTVKKILHEHGVFGFYKGCGVNLCRAVPSAAITFTSFELITRSFKRLFVESSADSKTLLPLGEA